MYDLAPLAGLTKRRVRALAKALGPTNIIGQAPHGRSRERAAGPPDEEVFGVSYEDIDGFLGEPRRAGRRARDDRRLLRTDGTQAFAPGRAVGRVGSGRLLIRVGDGP